PGDELVVRRERSAHDVVGVDAQIVQKEQPRVRLPAFEGSAARSHDAVLVVFTEEEAVATPPDLVEAEDARDLAGKQFQISIVGDVDPTVARHRRWTSALHARRDRREDEPDGAEKRAEEKPETAAASLRRRDPRADDPAKEPNWNAEPMLL